MLFRTSIAAAALTASLAAAVHALAFDQTRYPDWTGAWRRIPVPGVTGQPGGKQDRAPVGAQGR